MSLALHPNTPMTARPTRTTRVHRGGNPVCRSSHDQGLAFAEASAHCQHEPACFVSDQVIEQQRAWVERRRMAHRGLAIGQP